LGVSLGQIRGWRKWRQKDDYSSPTGSRPEGLKRVSSGTRKKRDPIAPNQSYNSWGEKNGKKNGKKRKFSRKHQIGKGDSVFLIRGTMIGTRPHGGGTYGRKQRGKGNNEMQSKFNVSKVSGERA